MGQSTQEAVRSCLACGSGAVKPILDLGHQVPANTYLKSPSAASQALPLGLAYCEQCRHGQLTHHMDPSELFSNYSYASGTSNTLRSYFEWLAHALAERFALECTALEIASNDGSFLSALCDAGFTPEGIDPASNIVAKITDPRFNTIVGFFPELIPHDKTFDFVVAQNVVAHTPTPLQFFAGIKKILKPSGIFLMQTSQARMIERGEFDTIYHEHYSFFTPTSVEHLAARSGLKLLKTDVTKVHGDSFVFQLVHDTALNVEPIEFQGTWIYDAESTQNTIKFLRRGPSAEMYSLFSSAAANRMDDVFSLVSESRKTNPASEIWLVGAAAKAITFARAANLDIDRIFDEAPEKIGTHVPGLPGVIESLSSAQANGGTPLCLIAAWNFRAELHEKVSSIAGNEKVRFVVYFPHVDCW